MKTIAIAVLLAALVSGCGGGAGSTVPPPPPPSPAGTTIGSAGGTVTSSDGNAVLTFPAGALSSSLAITTAAMTDPPASPGLISALAYDFGPTGSQFNQPVTITLHYQPSQVPAGISPVFLRMFVRNGSGWDSVRGSSVDTAAHTVTGTTTHFSGFAACGYPVCGPVTFGSAVGAEFDQLNSAMLQQGASVQVLGTIETINYSGTITTTVENLPLGVTGSILVGPPPGQLGCATSCYRLATLTLNAAASAVPGAYSVNVRTSTGGGIPDAVEPVPVRITALPGFALSVLPTAMSIAQGNTATGTVSIARTLFTTPVSLALSGVPAGVTASFNPAQLTGSTTSSTLTLTASQTVTAATTNFTVTASASGISDRTQIVPLTVAAFSLAANPTTLTVAAGGTVTSAIKAIRAGGFNGAITYAVVGVPTGLSATVTATTVPDSEVLSVTATSSPTAGSFPITVTGTSGGVQQQASVLVTVSSTGGSLDWSQCSIRPIWLAYQDGNGPWIHLTGTGDVYSLPTFTSGKGGFAEVLPSGGGFILGVSFLTQAELPGGVVCIPSLTTSGSVSGIPAGGQGFITLGRAGTVATANGAFQIGAISPGTHDLVAYLQAQAQQNLGSVASDRVVINRGGLMSVNFGAGIAPVLDTFVVNGTSGGALSHTMSYITRGCEPGEIYYIADSATGRIPVFGVPASLQQSTDLHSLQVTEVGGNNIGRTVTTMFHTLAPSTISLGSLISPVVTALAGPYKRLQGIVTLPADYNSVNMSLTFGSSGKVQALGESRGYSGTGTITLAMPDFSSVAGFSTSWVAATTDLASYVISANSGVGGPIACAEGTTNSSSYQVGSN